MGMGVCVLMTLSFVSFYKYIDCDRLKFSYQVHCGYKVLWSACVCAIRDCLSATIFSKNICPSFSNFSMESNQFFRPRTFLFSLSCIWFLVTGVFFMLLLPLFRCLFKICYDSSVTVNNRGSVFRLLYGSDSFWGLCGQLLLWDGHKTVVYWCHKCTT